MGRENHFFELTPELFPEAEDLPGSLKEIAIVIGVESTIKLSQEFGGAHLYIRTIGPLMRTIRNNHIRKEYDSGSITVARLARKYGLSVRHVEKILTEDDA